MDKIDSIKRIPLFADLSNDDVKKLADIAEEVSLNKGEKVFTERDIGDSLFMITSGSVRVIKKGSEGGEEIARLNSGQHFGEIAIIDKDNRSATVETLEDTKLIKIEHGKLEAFLAQDEDLACRTYKSFAKYLCRRLRQTTKDLTHMMDITKQLRKYNYYPEGW